MFWTTLSFRIMHMIAARHSCSNSYTCALTSECPWQRKKHFYHTGTLISGLWARFSEDGSTAPVRQVTKKPFTYSRIFDQTKIHLARVVVLPGQASLRRLIHLTMGVLKPHYFFRITKEAREDLHGRPARKTCTEDLHGSAERPAHVDRFPRQLQWEDHLHGRTINLHWSIPSVSSSQFGCQTSPCSLHTWSTSHINPLPYHPTCQQ